MQVYLIYKAGSNNELLSSGVFSTADKAIKYAKSLYGSPKYGIQEVTVDLHVKKS